MSWQIFDEICSDKRVHGVPILVLVNKTDQEAEGRASLESIKEVFTKHVDKLNLSEAAVMPTTALKG
jgi:signal recognition particle receptor subunit beta